MPQTADNGKCVDDLAQLEKKMKNKEKNQEDPRPAYVSPRVIRLDDVYSGAGGTCTPTGSGVATGNCLTGGGAGVDCRTGNGARTPCVEGNGFH